LVVPTGPEKTNPRIRKKKKKLEQNETKKQFLNPEIKFLS
jgi:hypothetical protein